MNSSRLRAGPRGRLPFAVGALALTLPIVITSLPAIADDGDMVRKNVSDTPDAFTEQAALGRMATYVPAQKADGTLVTVEYYDDIDNDNQTDGTLVETLDHARPLLGTFFDEVAGTVVPTDGQVSAVQAADGDPLEQPLAHDEELGTGEFQADEMIADAAEEQVAEGDITIQSGVDTNLQRDAFASVSFDDGATWKQENLSDAALKSSFKLEDGTDYPGDTVRVVQAVAGDKILVAWTSKYCAQGSPRYAEKALDGTDLYDDPFQVAGNQGSVDYAEYEIHGDTPFADVGEVPFSCIWTARGTLLQDTADLDGDTNVAEYRILWRKAERLTSGRRDADVPAVIGATGAGFALVWQEDPEGLRPGSGEGPGVGWSGATVNHKTDMWYSSIAWGDFDPVVLDDMETPEDSSDDVTGLPDGVLLDSNRPKVATQMAMPVRLTDNDLCLEDDSAPYCTGMVDTDGDKVVDTFQAEFNLDDDPEPEYVLDADASGTPDLCQRTVSFTNNQGALKQICVTEDGRLLNGQVGASRTRMDASPYTRGDGSTSAWVVLAYEETKGLGLGHDEEDEKVEPIDDGKDVMYHTFDMFQPDMVAAGHMLNMPQRDADPASATYGEVLPPIASDLSVLDNGGDHATGVADQYLTEIARRAAVMVQPVSKLLDDTGAPVSGRTSAAILYKEGTDNQGGPADIFYRRFEVPDGFDPAADNPYEVENIVCEEWDTSGLAMYPATEYPNGVCLDGATNVSGTTPTLFDTTWEAPADPQGHDIDQRVAQYVQLPFVASVDGELDVEPETNPTSGVDYGYDPVHDQADLTDLDDFHWENPYDLSKGHRGFLDGDLMMVMYAYSPNWLATSKGHEPYNLMVRRSFDGGETFTTTPAADPYLGVGTSYEQVYGVGDDAQYMTFTYDAGVPEQARNVSMMTSSKETVLDPRYTPTTAAVASPDTSYPDAVRDRSRFFVVYETGDTSLVDEDGGEAEPEDLYYSRATLWGDEYDTVLAYNQNLGVEEERWDWLENDQNVFSGEASVTASADGTRFYAVWNQWEHDDAGHETNSDAWFRRLWWYPDDTVLGPVTVTEPVAAADEVVTLTTWIADSWIADGSHTATVDWGDGTGSELLTVTAPTRTSSRVPITGTHAYASAGFYTATLSVVETGGGSDTATFDVVVYDPQAGTVDSNKVTFVDPVGGTTASLVLNARYMPDATTPDGKVLLSLGGQRFEATGLDWLVVDGDAAHVRGEGTLDGVPGHEVLVTAVDGKTDLVRVRIWNGAGTVYDSQPGADDLASPTTRIAKGGSITIERN